MNRALLALLIPIGIFVSNTFAADSPSTPEERTRIVNLARQLEADPAASSLHADREWAIKFLIQASDIHVVVCEEATSFLFKKKHYKFSSDLMALSMIEGGRFDIENPHQPKAAQARAMLDGTLRGYEALVKTDPKAQFKEGDEMLAKRDAGQLDAFFVGACENKSR